MMFARCPACQTVFRVRPEQLRARHGEVRCGHCFNPFNALDHLLTEAGTPATTAVPAAPIDDAFRRGPAPQQIDVAASDTEPAPEERQAAAFEATGPEPASTGTDDDPALDFEIPEVWRSPREQLKTQAGALPEVHETPADEAPDSAFDVPPARAAATPLAPTPSFAASLAAAGGGRTEPGDYRASSADTELPGTEDESPLPPGAPDHAPPPPPTREEARDELPDEWRSPAPADLEHLDARYGPEPAAGAGRKWLWSLGVGLMLGALTVQSAYLFRQEITRSVPALRPLYQAACAQFGCSLPLPRDAERIGIDASDLQSDPRIPGRFVLFASIRNNAAYPQAWPHLELTLTDARDRAVVRRVLDPFEWAHAETAKLRAGFPAGREQAVELHFDAPSVEATGSRIYVFYP